MRRGGLALEQALVDAGPWLRYGIVPGRPAALSTLRPGRALVDAGPLAQVRDRPRIARLNGSHRTAPAASRALHDLAGRGGRREGRGRGCGRDREHHHLADAVPLEVRVLERAVELGPVERERDPADIRAAEHLLEVGALPRDPYVLRGARAPIDRQDELQRLVGGKRLLDLLARQRHAGRIRTSPNVLGRADEHRGRARPVALHGASLRQFAPQGKSGTVLETVNRPAIFPPSSRLSHGCPGRQGRGGLRLQSDT